MSWRVLNLADTAPFPGVLEALEQVAEVVSHPAEATRLARELPRADAYFSGLAVRLESDLICRCPRLKAVATPSTGWDHLDVGALEARGIPLLSLRGEEAFLSSITATAELAWGLLLAVVRRLRLATRLAGEGCWARDACRGHQLAGQTLGIVGYGRLGRIIAEYGHAFRMRVVACDPHPREAPGWVKWVSLEECLRRADVLTLHLHLTPETRGLIGRDAIARMKPGAVLINTSRGGLLDEAALLEALRSGHLSGAGLDVVDGEWGDALCEHPVLRYARAHEHLVVSPHIGGITWESQRAAYAFTAEKLARWIASQS